LVVVGRLVVVGWFVSASGKVSGQPLSLASVGFDQQDLEAAIELFQTFLGPNQTLGPQNERLTLWNRAARELTAPRAFNFPALP
jgi:hypothetical protein